MVKVQALLPAKDGKRTAHKGLAFDGWRRTLDERIQNFTQLFVFTFCVKSASKHCF
jgi:hypothetical protein